MLKNYFKPTPKNLLKISLALRGMVGTISGAAYVQGYMKAAFWFLVAGAVMEFIIQCLSPNQAKEFEKGVMGPKSWILLLAAVSALAVGCGSTKTTTNSSYEKNDSTWTEYKPVDVKVKGSTVSTAINMDSLMKAAKANKDSANKPGPAQTEKQKPTVITDPATKVQLEYWMDEFGKLNMQCSSKDQTIQMLVAEINRLSKEKSEVTVEKVITQKPFFYYVSIAINVLLALLFILYLIDRWRIRR